MAKTKVVKNYYGNETTLNSNSSLINPDKFRKLVQEANLNYVIMSKDLGYAYSAVKNGVQRGVFSNFMINAIETKYGIKYKDYAYVEPVEEPINQETQKEESAPQPKPAITQEDLASIYNVIRAAVIDGMSEAIAGSLKNIRGAVYTGMYQAIASGRKEGATNDLQRNFGQ